MSHKQEPLLTRKDYLDFHVGHARHRYCGERTAQPELRAGGSGGSRKGVLTHTLEAASGPAGDAAYRPRFPSAERPSDAIVCSSASLSWLNDQASIGGPSGCLPGGYDPRCPTRATSSHSFHPQRHQFVLGYFQALWKRKTGSLQRRAIGKL
jgi:hypothetical protein